MLELHLPELLEWFKDNTREAIEAIHNDELLSKREVNGLFIANASKELHSVTEKHQQLAKGIVYDSDFNLISFPLAKMWNAHEMEQEQSKIVNELWADEEYAALIYILEKLDGTMISRFVYKDEVYFSTRGVLSTDMEMDSEYVKEAISIATEKYPRLLDPSYGNKRTLIFELIFPEGRILTDYGNMRDLVLTGAFDLGLFCYAGYHELGALADYMNLRLVERFVAKGNNWREQMDNMLDTIKGTDEEGFMMTIEIQRSVVYRMKFKGEDYIRMLKLMNYCTYKHVVEMILADKNLLDKDNFLAMLMQQSADDLPEYVLDEYMEHHNRYRMFTCRIMQYCTTLKKWFDEMVGDRVIPLNREDKKWFAHYIAIHKDKSHYFKFADGKTVEQLAEEIYRDARHDFNYLEKYGVFING